jgi:6-phosphogluconolactonase
MEGSMRVHMYASVQGDNLVKRYQLNVNDGGLTHVGDIHVPNGPDPLGINPASNVLYVGHRGAPSTATGGDGIPRPEFALSSWAIDHRTGDLTNTGRVPVLGEPSFVSTDRRGRFVLSSYYQAGHCAVHPLDGEVALGGDAIEWLATHQGAYSFQTDRSNRFGFAPHIADGSGGASGGLKRLAAGRQSGANAIFQFRFDQETGKLTPNDPPRVTPALRAGPRHACFHPTEDLVYVNNEQDSTVTVYALDGQRGTLSRVQTLSTLPKDATGRNAPSQIRLDHSGRFLYCSNRGTIPSPATRSTRRRGASLPAAGPQSASAHERSTLIRRAVPLRDEPSDRRHGGRPHRSANGRLTPLATYELGSVPMWVLFATLSGP